MSCVDLSASPLPGLLGGASGDPHDHLQYSDPSDGSNGMSDGVPFAFVHSSPTGRPPQRLETPSASSLDTSKNRAGVDPHVRSTNASPESSPSDTVCTVVPTATQPPYPSEDDYHPSGNPRPRASYPTNHRQRRGLDVPQPPCPTPDCGVDLENTIHEYAIGSVATNTVNTSMPVPGTTHLPSYSESLAPPHLPCALTRPVLYSTSAVLCLGSTPPPPLCVCPPYVVESRVSYPCLRHVAGPENLTQARARITRTQSMVERVLGRTDFSRRPSSRSEVRSRPRFGSSRPCGSKRPCPSTRNSFSEQRTTRPVRMVFSSQHIQPRPDVVSLLRSTGVLLTGARVGRVSPRAVRAVLVDRVNDRTHGLSMSDRDGDGDADDIDTGAVDGRWQETEVEAIWKNRVCRMNSVHIHPNYPLTASSLLEDHRQGAVSTISSADSKTRNAWKGRVGNRKTLKTLSTGDAISSVSSDRKSVP